MGVIVDFQARRRSAAAEARRSQVNDAILALSALVNEHAWDSCDVADAIVDVVAACDLHHEGNLAGLILNVPDDYSDLLSGLHYPEEQ
ncbi:hypothetical protein M527_13225 [Sphingobium indicum IP26]|uniref:Uncharacterized protein n=1 Tax=Sphingobium indicum F2 TaxID=1450518 RepID=A0A8E1C425_9SPHN|nr:MULTISPECIES: hypothetical protein [Sphingobium]EPR18290.1 hypothetical protein M527_13225 [Sphingobium indicum IP26]EQB06828.1 hypothetical protein L286_05780 [Sphingobium sp. HDIP04]KER37538.1 hypothetical protein AL00_04800 [Sphingobium indicum F2]